MSFQATRFERDEIKSEKNKLKPQPKWMILQIMNIVVFTVFVSSVTYVGMNYKTGVEEVSNGSPFNSFFFPILVLWSCCLAYFFGFFGISFINHEAISESPSSFGLEDYSKVAAKAANANLTPRNDTPICAEKQVAKTLPQSSTSTVSLTDLEFQAKTNEELLEFLIDGTLKDYQLEKKLANTERAVQVRRLLYEHLLNKSLDLIPYTNYNYDKVLGANAEIVIGYVPIPLGVAGPLLINNEPIYVPMATTEGCLIASANRGCKAITASGGCYSIVLKDAITRAPCLQMPSALRAGQLKRWTLIPANYKILEEAFNSTTNFGKLIDIEASVAGRNVFLRFSCMSGDAMGMNMVSKGCLKAIEVLEQYFPDLKLIAISGNMCCDKKPSAINWILGRGKSIVVEAKIPGDIVKNVLKTTCRAIIETNRQKNHIGSAMAGSIGGFNAHAANILTAIYLATGQDPAQNVGSSNCITIMEPLNPDNEEEGLHVSVTMPSIEVGTVGGGTHLPAQSGCLEICGCRGAAKGENASPGDNSRKFAMIVGGAVLAGELSLIAALAANHLVQAHMVHNRKPNAPGAPAAPAAN